MSAHGDLMPMSNRNLKNDSKDMKTVDNIKDKKLSDCANKSSAPSQMNLKASESSVSPPINKNTPTRKPKHPTSCSSLKRRVPPPASDHTMGKHFNDDLSHVANATIKSEGNKTYLIVQSSYI